jgi:hypothetical protein
MFSRADRDGNGSLSPEEFRMLGKKPPAGGPAGSSGASATDSASDTRAMDAAFKALDTDNDGQLTATELAKGRHHRHGQGGTPAPIGTDSLAALLGAQESAAASQGMGGLQAVMARLLQAYGGGTRPAASAVAAT